MDSVLTTIVIHYQQKTTLILLFKEEIVYHFTKQRKNVNLAYRTTSDYKMAFVTIIIV